MCYQMNTSLPRDTMTETASCANKLFVSIAVFVWMCIVINSPKLAAIHSCKIIAYPFV